jgi:hypothetical protein
MNGERKMAFSPGVNDDGTISAQSRHEAAEVSASSSLGFVALFFKQFETELNLIPLQLDHAILCGAATANARF